MTIALSIVLHSSSDVPVARMLSMEPPDNLPTGRPERDGDVGVSEDLTNAPEAGGSADPGPD